MAPPPKDPPVEGLSTNERCPRCGKRKVIMTYQRLASRVFYCKACSYVWTIRGPHRDEP